MFSNATNNTPDDIVITVSPLGNSKGLYIATHDVTGFRVAENDNSTSSVSFAWMAIAKRKDAAAINHAPELLRADFDKRMNKVMFNDNNKIDKAQPIWWDGTSIRFDNPPVKKQDPQYQPMVRPLAPPAQ